MAKASRKESKWQEIHSRSEILYESTQTQFVKIKLGFIKKDKVQFSAVKIGQKGKSIDVYMDAFIFDNWCDDIISERMMSVLTKEYQAGFSFPERYKYVTGETANKSVGFCASKKPGNITINIKVDDEYANIPVSLDVLKASAKVFKSVWGNYLDRHLKTIISAVDQVEKYHTSLPEDLLEEAPVEKDEQPAQQEQAVQQALSPVSQATGEPSAITISVESSSIDYNGGKCFLGKVGEKGYNCIYAGNIPVSPSVTMGAGVTVAVGVLRDKTILINSFIS